MKCGEQKLRLFKESYFGGQSQLLMDCFNDTEMSIILFFFPGTDVRKNMLKFYTYFYEHFFTYAKDIIISVEENLRVLMTLSFTKIFKSFQSHKIIQDNIIVFFF